MSTDTVQHILVFSRTVRDLIKAPSKSLQDVNFSDTSIFDVDKLEQEFKDHMKKVSYSGAKKPAMVLAMNASSLTEGVVDGKDGSFSAYFSAIYNTGVENNTFIYLFNKPKNNASTVDVVKKYECLKEYEATYRLCTAKAEFNCDELVEFIDNSQNAMMRKIKPNMTRIYEITRVKEPSYFMYTTCVIMVLVAIVFGIMYVQKSGAIRELKLVINKLEELNSRLQPAKQFKACIPFLESTPEGVTNHECISKEIDKIAAYSNKVKNTPTVTFSGILSKLEDEIKSFNGTLQALSKSRYANIAAVAMVQLQKLEEMNNCVMVELSSK